MAHGYGYRSDVRLRKENQDTLGVFEFDLFKLVVVCDGMGGHVGGRQASALAVRTVHDAMSNYRGGDLRAALVRAIEMANSAIHEAAHNNYRLMGMGTTIVAAVIHRQTCHVAWVGDSRVYLLSEGAQRTIRQLTRDHTMVNLFVDAELLSPEDAATHPEAHVLSRSLGVERTVEVDLADPVQLSPTDRLLLCSDGVHGVLGSQGLGQVDWSNVLHGIEQTFQAVAAADGDDNATLVAFGLEVSGGSMPTTPAPDLDAIETEARETAGSEGVTARRRATTPTMLPDEDLHEDVSVMEEGEEGVDAPIPVPQPAEAAPLRNKAPAQLSSLSALLNRIPLDNTAASLASIAGVIVLIGGTFLFAALQLDGDAEPRPQSAALPEVAAVPSATPTPAAVDRLAGDAEPLGLADAGLSSSIAASPVPGTLPPVFEPTAPLITTSNCHDCSLSYAPPSAAVYLDGGSDPSFTPAFFVADFPAAPRRPPVSGSRYDRRPPGGPAQVAAAQAVRSRRCREALDTVSTAVSRSMDYAALYNSAWFCFNDTHQAQMLRSRAETFEDLVALLVHLEGNRGVMLEALAQDTDAALANADSDAGEPQTQWAWTWRVPAQGGLEYRLGSFLDNGKGSDGNSPGLSDVIIDLQGEGRVADDLALDLLLELTVAAAIARQPEHTPAMIDVWARRVYVATVLRNSAVGDLVRTWRGSDIRPLVDALYEESTSGDLPVPVAEALALGRTGGAGAPPIAVDRIATLGSMTLSEDLVDPVDPSSTVARDTPPAAASRPEPSRNNRSSSSTRSSYTRRRPAQEGGKPSVLKVWYPHRPDPVILSTRRGGPGAPEGGE